MSLEIPVAFSQKFRGDFIMLSQQKESRLQRTVRQDPDQLMGKAGFFDRIGSTDAQEVTTRHGDTPLISTPHSRRRIVLRDFDWADLIDKRDMRRMISAGQLAPRYNQNAIWAMNRKKDDLIIAAAIGNAFAIDEDDGALAVPLPASQKVGVDIGGVGSGLNLAKLLAAKEIIDGSDVDEDETRYAAVSAKQVTNLLETTEVKSADFNTVKALVEGRINTFLGFEFIRTQRLKTDVNGDRQNLFYTQSALGIAFGDEIATDIGPRRDKRNSIQVFVDMSMDATRIEDEKLVEVAAREV